MRCGRGNLRCRPQASKAPTISVAVPLFLIARERRLGELQADPESARLTRSDMIGVLLFALPALLLTLWSLRP